MKIDVMGLLYQTAMELKESDPARAFSILELGNNLRVLMRGEATIGQWNATYVGADCEEFDIEKLLPVPDDDQ